jgi:hypothetical protein
VPGAGEVSYYLQASSDKIHLSGTITEFLERIKISLKIKEREGKR